MVADAASRLLENPQPISKTSHRPAKRVALFGNDIQSFLAVIDSERSPDQPALEPLFRDRRAPLIPPVLFDKGKPVSPV